MDIQRVAIIGGASKGLGYGCAVEIAHLGYNIVLCARNKDTLQKSAHEIETKGVKVLPICADMGKSTDNTKIIGETIKEFGRIDVLVNNSGGPPPGKFHAFSESDWENAFQNVLMYNIRMTTLAVEVMRANKWGRIINITSLSVKEPAPTLVLSNVFRTGVVSFAKSIAKDLIKDNITINNICPGAFKTDRAIELMSNAAKASNKTIEEIEEINRGNLPLGRYQEPNELGALVAFLCQEKASGITGATITIDGGISNSLF